MRLLWLGALLLAAAALAACGGGRLSLNEALRQMVLQSEDLPEGLERGEESFLTNDELAAASADPEGRGALLESWGRISGFEVAYRPAGSAKLPLQGINVSSSLYENEEGAGESFADAVEEAEETDWAARYPGLRGFQRDEIEALGLADEIVWLRLSGFRRAEGGQDELVTDDLIFFREGRERGFLRVLAATQTENRGHYQSTVEGWLRTLVGKVQEVLPRVEEGE